MRIQCFGSLEGFFPTGRTIKNLRGYRDFVKAPYSALLRGFACKKVACSSQPFTTMAIAKPLVMPRAKASLGCMSSIFALLKRTWYYGTHQSGVDLNHMKKFKITRVIVYYFLNCRFVLVIFARAHTYKFESQLRDNDVENIVAKIIARSFSRTSANSRPRNCASTTIITSLAAQPVVSCRLPCDPKDGSPNVENIRHISREPFIKSY